MGAQQPNDMGMGALIQWTTNECTERTLMCARIKEPGPCAVMAGPVAIRE